ncbi:hypothetical protein J2X46_001757 [Nocardioides sp. BE266]|nr:hypothetical protein [Nocardioides sp. BE266]
MFGVGLAIAVIAWCVELACRRVGGWFVRVPDNASGLGSL